MKHVDIKCPAKFDKGSVEYSHFQKLCESIKANRNLTLGDLVVSEDCARVYSIIRKLKDSIDQDGVMCEINNKEVVNPCLAVLNKNQSLYSKYLIELGLSNKKASVTKVETNPFEAE